MGNPVQARPSLIGGLTPHQAMISSKPTNNLVTHLKNFEKGGLQRGLEHMSQLNTTKTTLAKRITSINEFIAKLPEAVVKIITKLK